MGFTGETTVRPPSGETRANWTTNGKRGGSNRLTGPGYRDGGRRGERTAGTGGTVQCTMYGMFIHSGYGGRERGAYTVRARCRATRGA